MAETQPKRPREEPLQDSPNLTNSGDSKRHKLSDDNSKADILNFLDEDEDDAGPSHDLTAIFTTLQQELDAGGSLRSPPPAADIDAGDEYEAAKSVIRHLLEASDDELGIPNRREDDSNFDLINSGESLPYNFSDDGGLWELEDENANYYYTVLQSELFM
ncbi:uncharacterized protein LOC127245244 [Andrographis paniculata]|uniref:uncharacterized protein LOC127245244 n=1 Tax=Andrographis paniculata TaxID=175694 RepID=UPI0021E97061|nr:uncharacterized protein LOC127245244 [Andrographis paniculata]